MTIATDASRRPVFTIGDRLRKARALTGLDVREFASALEIDRNTVTNYELEKTAQERMKPIVLRAWAFRSGVDYDWLINGSDAPAGGPSQMDDVEFDTSDYWSVASLARVTDIHARKAAA